MLCCCVVLGDGPFPAVLDLYVLGGGLSEKRASLLATRGFVVLTIVAHGYDDMPKNIREVHLDYFEEAIQFLKKQVKVSRMNRGETFHRSGVSDTGARDVVLFFYLKAQQCTSKTGSLCVLEWVFW